MIIIPENVVWEGAIAAKDGFDGVDIFKNVFNFKSSHNLFHNFNMDFIELH